MPHSAATASSIDTGLSCIVLLARFFGLPADSHQLQRQFGQSGKYFDTIDLLRSAKYLGFKAREIESQWSRLGNVTLPAIARHRDGHYFILAKIDEEKALVQDPLENRPPTSHGERSEGEKPPVAA